MGFLVEEEIFDSGVVRSDEIVLEKNADLDGVLWVVVAIVFVAVVVLLVKYAYSGRIVEVVVVVVVNCE